MNMDAVCLLNSAVSHFYLPLYLCKLDKKKTNKKKKQYDATMPDSGKHN